MCWYGQLLYKYNNNEEARNMFDNILKNFPKEKIFGSFILIKKLNLEKMLIKSDKYLIECLKLSLK